MSRVRIGLRDRVMLSFGVIALALSVLLAGLTWLFVSRYLVDDRLSTATTESAVNAEAVSLGLSRPGTSIPYLLDHLPSGQAKYSLLIHDGKWYVTSSAHGAAMLPSGVVAMARSGEATTQRIDNGDTLAAAAPVGHAGDAYFALYPLDDLSRTLRILSIALVAAAIITSIGGLLVGRFASRVALRPLAQLTDAASAVARGDLGARLHFEDDPDLGGLARSFNHTAAELQHRVAVDARFAGDVSHELRTPLTTMLNSMQVIRNRQAELPPAVREPVGLLSDDLDRFRRLVVDLLEISRDDSVSGDRAARDGSGASTTELVRIGDLVQHAADAAACRPVTVLTPGVDGVRVIADKRRLERIVANLVTNAETHGGGCLAVTVTVDGADLRVTVDDAGPGIPADRRDRIFERFARNGSSADGGVGLGLAIVDRHVRWLGGTVRVEDRLGGGARFVVELPLARP
jgi:two-component system, OmpR family, sensor histidine kinase MtrB